MPSRVVILGNAGSGKSYVARKLGAVWLLPIIDLDMIFWMPGSYSEKRPDDLVRRDVERKKNEGGWVIEGVYGELISLVVDRADFLVWMDIDWATCRASLEARRLEMAEDEQLRTVESFKILLSYAEAYWIRNGPRSQSGHAAIFEAFSGQKLRLRSREEASKFLQAL